MNILKKSIFISLVVIVVHYLIFQFFLFPNINDEFRLNLYLVYSLFFGMSVIGTIILDRYSLKNHETTGFAYLLILTIKMIVFFLISLFFRKVASGFSVEKISFIILMIAFLITDTYIASLILKRENK